MGSSGPILIVFTGNCARRDHAATDVYSCRPLLWRCQMHKVQNGGCCRDQASLLSVLACWAASSATVTTGACWLTLQLMLPATSNGHSYAVTVFYRHLIVAWSRFIIQNQLNWTQYLGTLWTSQTGDYIVVFGVKLSLLRRYFHVLCSWNKPN